MDDGAILRGLSLNMAHARGNLHKLHLNDARCVGTFMQRETGLALTLTPEEHIITTWPAEFGMVPIVRMPESPTGLNLLRVETVTREDGIIAVVVNIRETPTNDSVFGWYFNAKTEGHQARIVSGFYNALIG